MWRKLVYFGFETCFDDYLRHGNPRVRTWVPFVYVEIIFFACVRLDGRCQGKDHVHSARHHTKLPHIPNNDYLLQPRVTWRPHGANTGIGAG